MTTVLVTGVGSVIGYGIVRSLRLRAVPCRSIGADIYPDAVGQAWTDAFEQAPYTRDPGYDAWLARVVAKHRVDVLVPGIEPDVFHANASREFLTGLGVRYVLNRGELIELSRDKWLQYQALGPVGEDVRIPTALACDSAAFITRHGLPCLLKERCGSASKGLIRLTRPEDLAALGPAETDDTRIIQPIVGADDAEYTVGVFGDGCGRARATIAMRRTLSRAGATEKAHIVRDASLDAVIDRLRAALRPLGPTNFQFRLADGQWKLLEVNARISASTSLRAAFGYNEASMALDHVLTGVLPEQPAIRDGFAVRYVADHVVYDRHHF